MSDPRGHDDVLAVSSEDSEGFCEPSGRFSRGLCRDVDLSEGFASDEVLVVMLAFANAGSYCDCSDGTPDVRLAVSVQEIIKSQATHGRSQILDDLGAADPEVPLLQPPLFVQHASLVQIAVSPEPSSALDISRNSRLA